MRHRPNPLLLTLLIAALTALMLYPLVGWQREADRANLLEQQVAELTTQNRGPQGPDGDPGRAPTADEILAAVTAYCDTTGKCVGATGAQGAPGSAGASGPYTSVDIQCIANHWKLIVNGTTTRDLNVYCF